MVSRSYPRYGSVTKLPPHGKGSNKRCIPGCAERATRRVWMQVSYMRGDDLCADVCEAHKPLRGEPETEYMARMPAGVWRE